MSEVHGQCSLCGSVSGHFMGCPCSRPPLNLPVFSVEDLARFLDEIFSKNPELLTDFKKTMEKKT